MEGYFTFQWGASFSDGEDFIFKWGEVPHGGGGSSVLMEGGCLKKFVG